MSAVRDYDRGIVQLGGHTFAYLQPNGSWGWSNAGLVVGELDALLVDTFFDLPNTRDLLAGVRSATDRPITRLVNTHHNGDHVWGNQLVEGATIIAQRRCRDELLKAAQPTFLAGIMRGMDDGGPVSYLKEAFGRFDFSGIEITPPTVVFDHELSVFLDGLEVRLLHFGPAHTLGDVAVYVPEDKVLFTGDLLFLGSTPLLWEGSLSNWIGIIDRLLALDVQTVVPGHGSVCGPEGLREMQGYLKLVVEQGAALKQLGLPPLDAALKFDLGPYDHWIDKERITVNLTRLWLELDGAPPEQPLDAFEAFGSMAAYAKHSHGHQAKSPRE